MNDADEALRHSPLDEAHRALGAKMVPFGGWDMPLSYGTGTIAEHLACRHHAVAFDVSHLGTVAVTGAGAFDHLQMALSNDLRRISPGRAQYTHLLDAVDASVLDDIIVWWLDHETFHVMPNASNTGRVVDAIGGDDITDRRAIIAVQGPLARRVLGAVAPEAAAVGRFAVTRFEWGATTVIAAGTGYTGEDGVECAVPAEAAPAFWDAVMAAGALPAGLGARDTLRLEAGLPLHGHELGAGITPLQAGLGWVVGWDKPAFHGRAALLVEKEAGPARRLRGLAVEGRQPPREGCPVLIDGEISATVTSGNFSPVLAKGIAMAFLPPAVEAGAPIEIEVRGKRLAGQVVKLPFVAPAPTGRG